MRVHDGLPRSRQERPRSRRCAIAGWLVVVFTLFSAGSAHAGTPEDVLKAYLGALYAHDSRAAYRLISRADQTLKGEADYVREHPNFSGAALEIATALAAQIRYERLRTVIEGHRATVTFEAVVPDANDAAVDALVLGFDANRLAALSPEGRRRIRHGLDEMQRAGRLPVAVGHDERWELVREQGAWHVFLNWAGALVIRFTADVRAGLPWAFKAIQPVVRATPALLPAEAIVLAPVARAGEVEHLHRHLHRRAAPVGTEQSGEGVGAVGESDVSLAAVRCDNSADTILRMRERRCRSKFRAFGR